MLAEAVIPRSHDLDTDRAAALLWTIDKLEAAHLPWQVGYSCPREGAPAQGRRSQREAPSRVAPLRACGVNPVDAYGYPEGYPGSDWCKATAVADALRSVTVADVLVIHDGDVWCDGLPAAIEAVELGAPWAVPHRMVHRLSRTQTARVLAGSPFPKPVQLAQRPYLGHAGGGIVVVRRDVYEACPLDPRFVGWGQEDDSFALALATLYGEPWRGMEPLWHLWHTPQARQSRRWGSNEGKALFLRYRAAAGDPEAMRALLAEALVPA